MIALFLKGQYFGSKKYLNLTCQNLKVLNRLTSLKASPDRINETIGTLFSFVGSSLSSGIILFKFSASVNISKQANCSLLK